MDVKTDHQFDTEFMVNFCLNELLLMDQCDVETTGYMWFTCMEHLMNAMFNYKHTDTIE